VIENCADRYLYGFTSESEHVDVIFGRVCVDLFHKIRWSEHCLHDILPPVISQCHDRPICVVIIIIILFVYL